MSTYAAQFNDRPLMAHSSTCTRSNRLINTIYVVAQWPANVFGAWGRPAWTCANIPQHWNNTLPIIASDLKPFQHAHVHTSYFNMCAMNSANWLWVAHVRWTDLYIFSIWGFVDFLGWVEIMSMADILFWLFLLLSK